jgi:hypothetical protein
VIRAAASWKTIAVAAAIIGGISADANADKAAADTCATKLNGDGKAIYDAVVADKPSQETLRLLVERETRLLAISDKISRGSARENAIDAAQCVKLGLQ